MLALNGGTLNIESPVPLQRAAAQLSARHRHRPRSLLSRTTRTNRGLYRSLGLRQRRMFFDKETWGADRLVVRPAPADAAAAASAPRLLAQTPLSAQAQKDMLRLYATQQPDYMPGLSSAEKKDRLAQMSYQDFLLERREGGQAGALVLHALGAGILLRRRRRDAGAVRVADGPARLRGHEPRADARMDVLADLPGGQHGRQKSGPAAARPCISRTATRPSRGCSSAG